MRTMLTWKLPKLRLNSVMPLSKAKPRISSLDGRGRNRTNRTDRTNSRIPAFGVQGGMGEAVDAQEDRVLFFDAGLHAGALEMRENQVLKIAEFLVLRALARQFLRGNGLVTLEGFHRERPGHAQPLFVFERLRLSPWMRRLVQPSECV